jgi:hypothetical protein
MAARLHRPLKVIAFNVNGIWKWLYELSKKLQDLHVDVTLLSDTHLNSHEGFFIPNYYFHGTDCFPWRKHGIAIAVRKGIPHSHVGLPLLVSVEATGVCIPIGNSEVLLAAVCMSPGHAWNDADINEILGSRHMSLLAGDVNAKYPFWNNVVSNLSGTKLLNLLHINEFEISAPQCLTHYSLAGGRDVLDIFVHKNVHCQKSLSLTFWTQITYQSFST